MAVRTPKKPLKKPVIGSDTRRKTKTGSSTPKTKKPRPMPRFYEFKIRITAEEYAWGLPFFDEEKYLKKFVLDAYREKVKRSEAHDKEAKQKALASNINLLEPLLKEMHSQGRLGFLYEHGRNDGGDNGKAGKTRC
jgi:hypothetical protein